MTVASPRTVLVLGSIAYHPLKQGTPKISCQPWSINPCEARIWGAFSSNTARDILSELFKRTRLFCHPSSSRHNSCITRWRYACARWIFCCHRDGESPWGAADRVLELRLCKAREDQARVSRRIDVNCPSPASVQQLNWLGNIGSCLAIIFSLPIRGPITLSMTRRMINGKSLMKSYRVAQTRWYPHFPRSYFVDYEDTSVGVEENPTEFSDNEYFHWGLARSVDDEFVYWEFDFEACVMTGQRVNSSDNKSRVSNFYYPAFIE